MVVTNLQFWLLKNCISDSEFLKLQDVLFELDFITQSTVKEKTIYVTCPP